jgi:hypothetical protein
MRLPRLIEPELGMKWNRLETASRQHDVLFMRRHVREIRNINLNGTSVVAGMKQNVTLDLKLCCREMKTKQRKLMF